MLHPQAKALLDLIERRGLPPMQTLPPVEARAFYRDRRGFTQPEPPPVAEIAICSADGPHGAIPLRLYRPTRAATTGARLPVLVYFHGGGWIIGDLDTHDVLCRQLANASGCAVVSVDYRHGARAPLSGRGRRQPRRHLLGPPPCGGARRRCRRGSPSAATVPAATSRRWWPSLARDAGDLPVAFQLLIYPATDMRCGRPSHARERRRLPARRDDHRTTSAANYIAERALARLARLAVAARRPDEAAAGAGADRRLRPVARRRAGLRQRAGDGRQPRDATSASSARSTASSPWARCSTRRTPRWRCAPPSSPASCAAGESQPRGAAGRRLAKAPQRGAGSPLTAAFAVLRRLLRRLAGLASGFGDGMAGLAARFRRRMTGGATGFRGGVTGLSPGRGGLMADRASGLRRAMADGAAGFGDGMAGLGGRARRRLADRLGGDRRRRGGESEQQGAQGRRGAQRTHGGLLM